MAGLTTRLGKLERGQQGTAECRRCGGRHAADLATVLLAVREDAALCACACCGWVAELAQAAAEAATGHPKRIDKQARTIGPGQSNMTAQGPARGQAATVNLATAETADHHRIRHLKGGAAAVKPDETGQAWPVSAQRSGRAAGA